MRSLLPPPETEVEAEAAEVPVQTEPGGQPRVERVTITTE
jgi:hypothetical protein